MTPPPTTLDGYLLRVLGVPYWRFRITILWDGLRGDLSAYPYIGEAGTPRVIRSIRAEVATLLGGALLSALVFGWATPFLFWVVPQLIAQPLMRLYLLAEHTGCTTDRNGLTNTRTVLTSPVLRVLMWNMPYHAEHHLYPFIPFHRLADAHAVLREKLAYLQPGYARWHARIRERPAGMTWPTAEGAFHLGDMALHKGGVLPDAKLVWKTHGTLNAARDNVVLYPTSYGAQHPDLEWLIGPDGILDPDALVHRHPQHVHQRAVLLALELRALAGAGHRPGTTSRRSAGC